MLHNIIDVILILSLEFGYLGIFFLMTIESSFIPFPSEIVMIPAGYNSALWNMNIYIAFLAGTLWAMLWACINYFLWWKLWGPVIRKLIHRYWKYILLKEHHYRKSEKYFKNHGAITTLVGRFIPAVRQLISLPAGIFRMNFWTFLLFTTLWAWTWNAILLGIGYFAGQNDQLIKNLTSQITLWIILILGFMVIIYIQYVKKHAPELKELEEEILHSKDT